MTFTIDEILSATGGKLLCGSKTVLVSDFFTDSRKAVDKGMFVPVRGENVDGNRFISSALKLAAASFTDRMPEDTSVFGCKPVVLVDNCVDAMQRFAAWHRSRLHIPIVGITGSVGKTTAKEMVATALASSHKAYRTPGNKNSQVGVPISVCGIGPEHTAAVIEMGVSIPGEMERLARVVKPTCGVITTIGSSHIEFMKTRDNILSEKSHMADYLKEDSSLFVCGDNDLLSAFAKAPSPYKIITFGLSPHCGWRAQSITQDSDYTDFVCIAPDGREQHVHIPVIGEHNVLNALASLAVGDHLGQTLSASAEALRYYTPPKMRQRIINRGGICIIDDSYNASPDSMQAAINVLMSRNSSGKKFAVLAGMRELGSFSLEGHVSTGHYAKAQGVDILIAVGELGRDIAAGYGQDALTAHDNAAATELLLNLLSPGDSVLIKGSRGMKTEEIVEGLIGALKEE